VLWCNVNAGTLNKSCCCCWHQTYLVHLIAVLQLADLLLQRPEPSIMCCLLALQQLLELLQAAESSSSGSSKTAAEQQNINMCHVGAYAARLCWFKGTFPAVPYAYDA
jgi:hypothetical protein